MEGGNKRSEKGNARAVNEIEEREEMRDGIKRLERRVEELKGAGGGELEGVDVRGKEIGGRGIVKDKLIEFERKI